MARLLVAIQDGDGWDLHDTGIQGDFSVEEGGLIVPFSSVDNAVDCLRILTNSLSQPTGDEGVLN